LGQTARICQVHVETAVHFVIPELETSHSSSFKGTTCVKHHCQCNET